MLREPLNKPESSATRLLLRLSLLDPGPPKSPQSSRGLVQKFLRQGLLAVVGLLYLCSFKPARAELIVCNHQNFEVDVSVGYHKHVNDAWTAIGHYRVPQNTCDKILSFDLNEKVYFTAQTIHSQDTMYGTDWTKIGWTSNDGGGMSTYCVDKLHDYETIWDGDENIAYYKDLRSSFPVFNLCTNLRGDYRKVDFWEVIDSSNHDQCVVSLRDERTSSTLCWD